MLLWQLCSWSFLSSVRHLLYVFRRKSIGFSFPYSVPLSLRVCNISIFVAWTPYTKIHAMPSDMSVKPFETFPKQFYLLRNACGSHSTWHQSCTREGSQDIVSSVRPVSPEGSQCQDGMQSQCRWRWLSCNWLCGRLGLSWFHRTSGNIYCRWDVTPAVCWKIRCRLDHKGNLCQRTEYVPASKQPHGFCHKFKREHWMKSAKLTLIKTHAIFFQNIKFCKAQT